MSQYRLIDQQQSHTGKKYSETEIEMAHVTCYDAENGKKTKEEKKKEKGSDKLQQQIAEKEAEIAHLKQTINSMEVEKQTYLNRLQEADTAIKSQTDTINNLLSSGVEIVSKGQWCNSADLTEPSQLARNIQTIYKKQWVSAKRVLIKLVDSNRKDTTNEVVIIELLSEILQECYALCEKQARLPTERFFSAFSSDEDSASLESCSDVERHYIFKIRKKIGMRSAVRSAMEERITKDFWTRNSTPESFIVKFSETEIVSNNYDAQTDKEIETCLEAYISACIKACWGAVLCDPQVRLKFDIVGQNFAEIEEQYGLQNYSLRKRYQNKERKHDEIVLVVWPPCTTNIPSNGNYSENVIAAGNANVIVNNLP